MDQNPEQNVAEVAVAPARTRRIFQRSLRDGVDKLLLRVVFAVVELLRVIAKPSCMAQQILDTNALPRVRSIGKKRVMGSDKASLPRSASISTAMAVNCLVTEPD